MVFGRSPKASESGANFEDVNVDLKLWVLKLIHATWLVEIYNFFISPHGKVPVLKGWEKAGIKGVEFLRRFRKQLVSIRLHGVVVVEVVAVDPLFI